jgi:hypothetical protein
LPVIFVSLQPERIKLAVSIVGLFMHLGVWLGAWRTANWIRFWDDKLGELEQLDREPASSAATTRVMVFSDREFKKRRGGWLVKYGYLWPFGIAFFLWLEEIIRHGLKLYYH